MNFHNPPERTPELFERFLPYALALGVEQAWSEQFASVLSRAAASPAGADGHYSPRWYSGRGFTSRGVTDFASSLGGSFTGAIASSSDGTGLIQRLGRRRRQRLVGTAAIIKGTPYLIRQARN
jgi:hypothetical protein